MVGEFTPVPKARDDTAQPARRLVLPVACEVIAPVARGVAPQARVRVS